MSMSVLKNIKYERFAQAVIKHGGKNSKLIMEDAGYKHSQSFCSQLRNKPEIKARILELQKVANKDDSILNLTKRLQKLKEIAMNPNVLPSVQVKALHEYHRQCGDDVNKVDMDVNANKVVTVVEIALPKKELEDMEAHEKADIEATEDIGQFLDDVEVRD